jgi:hypothetical protein
MTSDERPARGANSVATPERDDWHRPALNQFLEDRDLVVADVVAGAAPRTKRLYLADRAEGRIRYAVAVSQGDGGDTAVANEALVLGVLEQRLPEQLRRTVPAVVAHIDANGGSAGVIVTAVPGLPRTAVSDAAVEVRHAVAGAVDWLSGLWQSTASDPAPAELGHDPVDTLLARYQGAAAVLPAIGTLIRARDRIASLQVVRTATHGCLCARHVLRDGPTVIGVDDWGRGSDRSDPLSDLGHLVVNLAAQHLPEVMAGRTTLAGHVRRGVGQGMELLHVPTRLWRDVLVLAQFEVAITDLGRGEPAGLSLLKEALEAVPVRS